MRSEMKRPMVSIVLAGWLVLSCGDEPTPVAPKIETIAVAVEGMAYSWERAPRIGLCEGRTVLCTVPEINVIRGMNMDGDTVNWQIQWAAPALDIPDSLSWRYRIRFGGTHSALSGKAYQVAPGGGMFAIGYGETVSVPRKNIECKWVDVLDVAKSVTIRPELVNPEIDSRWSHADDKGGQTRVQMPPYRIRGSGGDGYESTSAYRPRCDQSARPLVHEPKTAAATEFLDHVPPPDTVPTEPPPPPATGGNSSGSGTSGTSAPTRPTTTSGIPRIPIDLQVAVQRDGEVVSDGTVMRGDLLTFSVQDAMGVEDGALKYCWGAYPYGWYVDGQYRPWVQGYMPPGRTSTHSRRSTNCGHSEGPQNNPWVTWGERLYYIPYTFDYEVPADSMVVKGLCKVEGQNPCAEYWPGFEPKSAQVRCVNVRFTIWSTSVDANGNLDYKRYVVDEAIEARRTRTTGRGSADHD